MMTILPSNEQTEAELVDKVKAPDVETEIFSPEEFRKLLLPRVVLLVV
jgi:hypothetical protein